MGRCAERPAADEGVRQFDDRRVGSYRRAVVNQLQALGVEPIHQQDGRLDFGTIRTILKRRILMCDAVICLIGPAFGAAPDQSGVNPPRSYTQLEYDMARDLKKQIFILLSSPHCKLDKFTEDDPRPAWQQRFIQELGDNRYETFKDAGELQDQDLSLRQRSLRDSEGLQPRSCRS